MAVTSRFLTEDGAGLLLTEDDALLLLEDSIVLDAQTGRIDSASPARSRSTLPIPTQRGSTSAGTNRASH